MTANNTDLNTLYSSYVAEPTPENLSFVVDALKPTIDYNLRSRGIDNDLVLKNKARVFAAKAVQKYDPSYTSALPTFVSSQLQQLNRAKREASQSVKVSDRTQLDRFALQKSTEEFEDQHGREPDLNELSDSVGFSKRKIEKLLNASYAQVGEATFDNNPEQLAPEWTQEAMDYVYDDTDYLNRKIMEYKFGYGGVKPMNTSVEIAKKLKVDPAQISRRLFRISRKIEELEAALRQINQ